MPVGDNTAGALVRAVGAEEGEAFHLAGVGRGGFYLVLADAPGGDAMPATPVARASACRGRAAYEVRLGDTLSIIAMQHYGDPSLWQAIYTCNRESIGADPGLLTPGSTLVLP